MKLLAVGCLHGTAPKRIVVAVKKENPDAILCSGDLCDVDKLRNLAFGLLDAELIEALFDRKKYNTILKTAVNSMDSPLRFFRSAKIPVFLVYGNNDFLDRQVSKLKVKGLESRLPPNAILLKGKVVQFSDIYIAGFSGYHRHEKKLEKLSERIAHPHRTLLLTHDVPYKKFDLVKWEKSPALGRHVGEKLFNKLLRQKRFLGFICSHMHEHQGLDTLYGTPIINTGHGKEGRFTVIEIESGKITKVKFFK